jgi:hypothetical protein
VQSSVIDYESLFNAAAIDLDRLSREPTDYAMLRAAALIRQMFLDGDKSLVVLANRKHKLKIRIPVFGRPAMERTLATVRNSPAWQLHKPEPQEPADCLERQSFFKLRIGVANSHTFTVGDLVLTLAHVMGGVHAGRPKTKSESEILALFESEPGTEAVLPKYLVPIINVCLAAIRPLSRSITRLG